MTHIFSRSCGCLLVGVLLSSVAVLSNRAARADEPAKPAAPAKSPFPYIWGTAYHIPPETNTEEEGYFSLCEGHDGKIYIGTAAFGRNSYLVEFDPKTEKMRVVVDVHKVCGLPLTPTGMAAQGKIHTRNFVGPSGKIYLGSKQGHPTGKDDNSVYPGGYLLVYDPATEQTENLGMPMKGQGVIDVTADEARGLIYVITCEDQHWMLYDMKTKKYRELGPILRDQPNTIVDSQGRATAITKDYRVARYNPATDKVTIDDLLVDGVPFGSALPQAVHPDWRLAADGHTAYLVVLNDFRMFQIDLAGPAGKPLVARSLGNRVEGKNADSRGSVAIAPDGRVYSACRADNATGYGTGYLHHLSRYTPSTGKLEDLGVFTVKNPDFVNWGTDPADPRPKPRFVHGFHKLPDGTLTPLHVMLAMIVAHDGTIYGTVLVPFTLLKVEPPK